MIIYKIGKPVSDMQQWLTHSLNNTSVILCISQNTFLHSPGILWSSSVLMALGSTWLSPSDYRVKSKGSSINSSLISISSGSFFTWTPSPFFVSVTFHNKIKPSLLSKLWLNRLQIKTK
jgi:hypothetical protein